LAAKTIVMFYRLMRIPRRKRIDPEKKEFPRLSPADRERLSRPHPGGWRSKYWWVQQAPDLGELAENFLKKTSEK